MHISPPWAEHRQLLFAPSRWGGGAMSEDISSVSTVMTVAECAALLGESPVWVEREAALYWVDIKAPLIWRLDWASGGVTHWTPPFRIGALAPRANGGFVAGTERGFALIDLQTAQYEVIGNPEPELPGNRFNDGKLDPRGRFWTGTMDDREQKSSGALYRLTPDLRWTRIAEGYRVTNGPAFSPDGRLMYHSDSAIRTIYVFHLDEQGDVKGRLVFASFGEADGYPDGMTTDAAGFLWVAFWDGWCLRRFSPEGECVEKIDMPVQRPTSCTFAGPDLDHLLITSARIGIHDRALDDQPLAGALFMARPAIGGTPQTSFPG